MKQKTIFPVGFPKGKIAYFVTSNASKFQEAYKILAEYKIATAKLRINAIEIQDDCLENIAKYSVKDAVKKCGLPVFVEDAGLFIEALNGFPGPYSKYVYNTLDLNGILKLMKNVINRRAYFLSVVSFSNINEEPVCYFGRVNGRLSLEKRGTSGFGYDPIFIPSKSDSRTFAEMTIEEKNFYSHRAKALRKFAEWYSHFNKRRF
jgi:XTP/dITP diphosphohydrolase